MNVVLKNGEKQSLNIYIFLEYCANRDLDSKDIDNPKVLTAEELNLIYVLFAAWDKVFEEKLVGKAKKLLALAEEFKKGLPRPLRLAFSPELAVEIYLKNYSDKNYLRGLPQQGY